MRPLVIWFGCLFFTLDLSVVGMYYSLKFLSNWYPYLHKPTFAPPLSFFIPIAVIFSLLCGTAAFLVVREGWKKREVKSALFLFCMQLVLYALWPLLFFELKQPVLALLDLFWLILITFLVMRRFFKISHYAGFGMVPFVLWLMFMMILNFAIVVLN